jgi:hypothetical protein
MKQLLPLFLFLLPCLALAQYPSNGNQKITLGEQTTADGLIYRGVLADTGIITPSRDTSAYIILDTVNHRFYNYNRATNVWSMAGVGSISSGLTGVLPVANGGTNTSTAFTAGSVVFAGSGGTYTQDNSNLFWDNSNKRLGIGVSNPTNNLHIRNNDNTAVRLLFQNTLKGTSAQASIQLESNAGIGSINVYSDTFGVAGLPSTLLMSSGNLVNGIIINTSLSTAPIIFRINSTERMRLSTSGNLGIGQSTPTEKLHVEGNGLFTGSVTATRFNPTSSSATGNGMYLPSTNALGFSTNSINRIIIDNVGNLMYGGRNVIEASQGLATDGTAPTLQISKNDTATNSNDKIADIRLVNANSFNSGAIGRIVALNPLNPTIEKRVAQISFFQDSLNTGGFTFNVLNLGTLTRSMLFKSNGNIAIARPSDLIATARLHIGQGTATASTAPLKFTSGTNLTTAEAGAMEFNGTNLFFSPSTTRHTVNHGLTGSATLDFPSTTTLLSADLTITVTGAADGDVVSLGVPNAAVNANTSYSAWVSAANTVTVRFNNYSSGTVNPASGSFKVFVTK